MKRSTQALKSFILTLLVCILSFFVCHAQDCEKLNMRSAQLVNDYYYDQNITHLDSSLFYIDQVIKLCHDKYYRVLTLRKLAIYSLKKDFDTALKEIPILPSDIVDLPYYKDFLFKRFNAMKALNDHDTATYYKYLDSIVLETSSYILSHHSDVDSVIKFDNLRAVLNNPITFPLVQYYYYRSLSVGHDIILNEINEKVNKEGIVIVVYAYIRDNLKMDFMDFNGY